VSDWTLGAEARALDGGFRCLTMTILDYHRNHNRQLCLWSGVALAARRADVIAAITAAAAPHLDETALRAVRGAASVMAMNNVYYRFLHFTGDGSEYQRLPARLRMQMIGNPGVDHVDFELWCLAAATAA
jgi:hypothetical protein